MPNRRSLLKASVAAPMLLTLAPSAQAQLEGDVGVASGDPRPYSVVIWTRVPEFAQSGTSVVVSYKVSRNADLSQPVATGTFTTSATRDWTVKLRVSGLEPFTRYYYGFTTTTGYTSVTGRTKTIPNYGQRIEEVRFAYVSCQDFTAGYYTVYANMATQDDIDFCVHLGDNIYETGSAAFQGAVREDTIGDGEAKVLDEYRQKYKLYLTDPNMREVRRLFPWFIMWDDHEVFNDYAGTTVDTVAPGRRQDGYQAFMEYMPMAPQSTTDPNELRMYRKVPFGLLMDLILTDERQYRDPLICDTSFFTTGCEGLDDPNRTMLGTTQAAWLKDALQSSPTRRWKMLMSEVMWQRFTILGFGSGAGKDLPQKIFKNPLAVDPGVYINLDAWDGYPEERKGILQFIKDEGIKNVVVCTGDIHNCYAGELRPDFLDETSDSVAVEVVGGSVTSSGIAELTGGLDLTELGQTLILGANPSMKYLDLTYHVFTKMIVREEAVTVSYEAVGTVTAQTAQAFQLAKFQVFNGVSKLAAITP